MYQALYRKYRPKTFDDVVGQDFVIKTLKNSIINSKISHAYMFFGPRGIGKTSIAKILSRAVNCLDTKDGNPCEKCDNCLKSLESVDIIEIDAASNNGVDEIREIKSKVNIVPSELKYKVYIVDEVHMLTSGAFNALLKTLEEPPKHVIFILATTDPQKVSDTIISRCQCYSFKRISVEKIVEKLIEVCKKEQIEIEEKILEMIAEYSDGGLRDSLGMLDKLSSYKIGKITIGDFYEVNDMISDIELNEFKDEILKRNSKYVIEKIKTYNDNGKNLIEIISQLLISLRNDMISHYVENVKLSHSIDDVKKLINLLNEKMFDIKKSGNPRIYIEIILLNFMNTDKIISREIISDRNEIINNQKKCISLKKEIKNDSITNYNVEDNYNVEEKIVFEQNNENNSDFIHTSNIMEIMDIRINNIFAGASKEEKQIDENNIQKLNDYVFDQEVGYLVSEILNANLRVSSMEGIIISYEYDSVVEQNINEIMKIQEVYNKFTKSNKKIAIVSDSKWETIKKDYINNTKNGIKYDIIEEPELVIINIEETNENGKNVENPLDLFKDIVEIN